jgi:hypothetical protein
MNLKRKINNFCCKNRNLNERNQDVESNEGIFYLENFQHQENNINIPPPDYDLIEKNVENEKILPPSYEELYKIITTSL